MRIASIAKTFDFTHIFLRLKVYRTVKTGRKVFIMKVKNMHTTRTGECTIEPNTFGQFADTKLHFLLFANSFTTMRE
jgi:hypothetical protein